MVEPAKKFNMQRWLEQMRTLSETTHAIEVDLFYHFQMEITFLFKEFGNALSLAFSDVVEKA